MVVCENFVDLPVEEILLVELKTEGAQTRLANGVANFWSQRPRHPRRSLCRFKAPPGFYLRRDLHLPQIRFADHRIAAQLGRRAGQHHLTRLEHISAVGNG
jgi:hypothetical protein